MYLERERCLDDLWEAHLVVRSRQLVKLDRLQSSRYNPHSGAPLQEAEVQLVLNAQPLFAGLPSYNHLDDTS
jgi:hypothetical protein